MPNERKVIRGNSFQDLLFLFGIIVFSSILIIGLFPGRSDAGLVDENFFITTVMTIPVIAGIYFIVISFRRSLNIRSADIRESLKKKITLAFVFIAVLSAMPIVIISSTYFNQNLAKMFRGSTIEALRESSELIHEAYADRGKYIQSELEKIRFLLGRRNTSNLSTLAVLGSKFEENGCSFAVFRKGMQKPVFEKGMHRGDISADFLKDFYRGLKTQDLRIDRVAVKGREFISGAFVKDGYFVILALPVSEKLREREVFFANAYSEYMEVQNLKDYFESGSGSFLMILSILIVGIAYLISLYMSGNITMPILELSTASREIAKGNYNTKVSRKSDDEIGELVDAFNVMAKDLNENQKMMFQKQRLEAWNEMARKLVHEIKNPLTPIRLSVERMRKMVQEGNESRDEVVMAGTETVLAEVNALLALVREFNDFARLPEKKAELSDINSLIQESVLLFSAYSDIKIRLSLAENLPSVMIDKLLMRQAFNNIISNAVQAMKGRGELKVSSGADRDEEYVWINVSDDGPGVSPDDIEKIFVPGFTRKNTGSGLGLAIVEKIILEHDGIISCSSVPGEGAEFRIRLPFTREKNNG